LYSTLSSIGARISRRRSADLSAGTIGKKA
jgi:hypothetical protein